MLLVERSEPFNHPEWIYEIKYDGFRALACDDGQCQLVSRKGNIYKNFSELCDSKSDAVCKVGCRLSHLTGHTSPLSSRQKALSRTMMNCLEMVPTNPEEILNRTVDR